MNKDYILLIDKFVEKITSITRWAVLGFAVSMAAIVFAQVILRYFFHSSIFIAEELSRFLFVWTGFLSATLALRKGSHVAVNMVVDALPPRVRKIISVLTLLALIAFLITLFVASLHVLFPHQWVQRTPTIGMRVFWFYLSIPVSLVLMLIQLVPQLLKKIGGAA